MFSRFEVGARIVTSVSWRYGSSSNRLHAHNNNNNRTNAAGATAAASRMLQQYRLRYFSFNSALVTGGSQGIGEAICRRLASDGYDVVIADINKEKGEALAIEIDGTFIETDVSKPEDVKSAISATVAAHGGLSALVNNAGVAPIPTLLTNYDNDEWKRVLDINLNGTFYGMKYGLQQMSKQQQQQEGRGCSIVNMASIAAFRGHQGYSPYSASKFAVRGLTQVAAVEYAKLNIRVNAIAPTCTDTPMIRSLIDSSDDPNAMIGFLTSINAMEGLPQPTDIASVCSFLLNNNEARYITGHTLPVDAGSLCRHANAPQNSL